MITIKLPSNLHDKLWLEYGNIGYGLSGYKGFRFYLQDKISNCIVSGNARTGFYLEFTDEKDYVYFMLRDA